MKENFYKAVTAVSCIISAVCLIQINGLKNDIANTRNTLSNQISTINNSVNSISSNVYSAMEREASLLSGRGWDYTVIDAVDGIVGIRLWVTPKEYIPERTKAEICLNGETYPMTLDNGSFVLDADISLYDLSEIKNVVFTEDETVRTENLDWYLSPRDDCIPYIDVSFSGSTTQANEHTINGSVNIDINGAAYAEVPEIENAYLVDVLNGEETGREKIDINLDTRGTSYQFGYYEISRTVDVPDGSVYKLCTALVDKNGLVYVNEVDRLELDREGNIVGNDYYRSEADVYNKKGELLCRGDY